MKHSKKTHHKHHDQMSMDSRTNDHDAEHTHHGGHNHHHEDMIRDFKKRFYISLVLTIPILILSPMIQEFFQFEFIFPGSMYLLFALATVLFFYGGWPFLKGLQDELRQKSPGIMTLISMAIIAAYVYAHWSSLV